MTTRHLLLKFRHFAWNKEDSSIVTIEEHQKIANEKGSCYWGRTSSIAPQKFEVIKNQVENNEKVYIFLYETHTPGSVHGDGIRWFRAELKDFILGSPSLKRELIPGYYRSNVSLEMALEIKNIEQLDFPEGLTAYYYAN